MTILKNSFDKIVPTEKAKTPSDLRFPTFAMVAPFNDSFSNEVLNNIWMQELPPEKRKIDYDKGFQQWMALYSWLASNALVYVIPSMKDLQDQIYIANLGIYIESQDVFIVSNYTSKPRKGEEEIGKKLFALMKYNVQQPPTEFEGEADLKFVKDNIFVGGYGIRSTIECYDWMERQFNIKIIKCLMNDEHQYHFDCMFFPLTNEKALVCTELYRPEDLKEIEKITEIIDVPKDEAYVSFTNCVRCGSNILAASDISGMSMSDEKYMIEASKIERLNHVCSQNGLGLVVFNLSEFNKSGAALSCCVLHLNYVDYQPPLSELL